MKVSDSLFRKDFGAFLLCAGRGSRLRPVTAGAPKALVPFLNLPLLCYNWFLLEGLDVSRFFLNSSFLTPALRGFAASIQKPAQTLHISHEKKPAGAAGGLRNLQRRLLPSDSAFFYLNGDSLIFPSPARLLAFKTEGPRRLFEPVAPLKGLFYAVPYNKGGGGALSSGGDSEGRGAAPGGEKGRRVLWADEGNIIRAVAKPDRETAKRLQQWGFVRPFRFSGLALLHRDIFKNCKPDGFHLFEDVLPDWIRQGRLAVFPDEEGTVYEADAPSSFLNATEAALKALFAETGNRRAAAGAARSGPALPERPDFVQSRLQAVFVRFDPEDRLIGRQRGRELQARLKVKAPLLCPETVKGTEFLSAIEGFAVIGDGARFWGESSLKKAVIGPGVHYKGGLETRLLIDPLQLLNRLGIPVNNRGLPF